jgi:GH15 family glucan-1,4-alpha-glucosidase
VPLRIEDYALIGNAHTAALVGRDGSIDWLCVPRFDSAACFAALLGEPKHGRWLLAPAQAPRATRRRYRKDTLILETDFETASGSVRVTDCMPMAQSHCAVVRVVEGLQGRVRMHMELIMRFDYGAIVPWVRRGGHGLIATAGPDTLELSTGVDVRGRDFTTVAEFEIGSGERLPFVLSHRASHRSSAPLLAADAALAATERWWHDWSSRCRYAGPWRDDVMRSLITLKALTYLPTGGIVAAPTTSLPEQPGGPRNWDYRYCWLRDAAFTLYALLNAGYREEASAWREWLLRAVAGHPQDMQILYGIAGERRLDELELAWLPGYERAAPVRVGNAASRQFQLDVYGEVMDTLHLARVDGVALEPHAWEIQRTLLDFLESSWEQPDEGIWEVRGPRRDFTHSKVMAWVAFDRAVKGVERFRLEGPAERWRRVRDTIHDTVCRAAFSVERNAFVQHFGAQSLDASLLVIPLVGFLPADDRRVLGTVAAIEAELAREGLVQRYASGPAIDGLPAGEGVFLPCSFWLADNLALQGRRVEAEALFRRLLGLCNDVGLIAEEYDPVTKRQLGNFPQAMTHVALINTARRLAGAGGRGEGD